MKNRRTLLILSVFIVGLGLLSLPLQQNIAIRNRIGEKISSLWNLLSTKQKPTVDTSSIDTSSVNQWLQEAEQQQIYAQEQAAFFTPDNQAYLIGKVLFRSINLYNSSLWIDLGSDSNSPDAIPIVAKNSPVLSGDSVVGVIDFVGKKTSLVRLISDPELTPSVRVARQMPDKRLSFAIRTLKKALRENNQLLKKEEKRKALSWLLANLSEELKMPKEPLFLAKGTLQGSGRLSLGKNIPLLKGSGFNYDFKDSHGPARDLRTGQPVDPQEEYTKRPAHPLVLQGDLLVTSGMDGVFPEGLKIAKVHSITPLSEGAYAFDLLATPTAEDLMDLQYVTVLPPQGFDPSDIPEQLEKVLYQLDATDL